MSPESNIAGALQLDHPAPDGAAALMFQGIDGLTAESDSDSYLSTPLQVYIIIQCTCDDTLAFLNTNSYVIFCMYFGTLAVLSSDG